MQGKWIVEYSNISTISFEDYKVFSKGLKEMGFSERDSLSCPKEIIRPIYSDILNKNSNPNIQIYQIDFVDWKDYYVFKEKQLIHPCTGKYPITKEKPKELFPQVRNDFVNSLKKIEIGNDQQKCLKKLNLSSNRFFYINSFHADCSERPENPELKYLGRDQEIHFIALLSIEVVCDITKGFAMLIFNFAEFDYSDKSYETKDSIDTISLVPVNGNTITDALTYAIHRNIRNEYEHRILFKINPYRYTYKDYNIKPSDNYSSEPSQKDDAPSTANFYSGINEDGFVEDTFEGYYGVLPAILSDEECKTALNLEDKSIEDYVAEKTNDFISQVISYHKRSDTNKISQEDYSKEISALFDDYLINKNILDNSVSLDGIIGNLLNCCNAKIENEEIFEHSNDKNVMIKNSTITLMNISKRDNRFQDVSFNGKNFDIPCILHAGISTTPPINNKDQDRLYSYEFHLDKRTYITYFNVHSLYLMRLKLSDLFCIGQYISLLLRYCRLFMIENTINDDNFDSEIDIFRKHYNEFINIKMRIHNTSISEHNEVNDLYYQFNKDTGTLDKIEDIHSYFKLRIESLDKKYQTEKSKKTDKTNTVLALISILGISSAVKSVADLFHDALFREKDPNLIFWAFFLCIFVVIIITISFLFFKNNGSQKKIKEKKKKNKYGRRSNKD